MHTLLANATNPSIRKEKDLEKKKKKINWRACAPAGTASPRDPRRKSPKHPPARARPTLERHCSIRPSHVLPSAVRSIRTLRAFESGALDDMRLAGIDRRYGRCCIRETCNFSLYLHPSQHGWARLTENGERKRVNLSAT